MSSRPGATAAQRCDEPIREGRHHNVAKGAIGHHVAMAKLVECGLAVFQGYTDVAGVDLVVDTSALVRMGGCLLGLQVKSTDRLAKGFRIPRVASGPARYYVLVETRSLMGDERWWTVPATDVYARASTAGTKSTIRDLIWRPSEEALAPYAGVNAVQELRGAVLPRFHASRVGKVGEALAAAWLIKQGFAAYPTTADHEAVDLIVERGGKVRFVQVKYAARGLSFRNIRVPKGNEDRFLLMLVRGEPRGYYVLEGPDALKYRSAHGTLYLSAPLRKRFCSSLGML